MSADSESDYTSQTLDAVALIASCPSIVVGQLGQTLDGRIATKSGESQWINGPAALDHLHRLRAAVDCVVVGIGTVLADDPRLTVRRVAGVSPARVVIDAHARLPSQAACMNGTDGCRRLVIRGNVSSVPAGAECLVVRYDQGAFQPTAMIAALRQQGFQRILIEGGAATVSGFIDDGALDRLHVLVAPMIIGSGVSGLSLAPITKLSDALRPETQTHLLDDGNVLFDCRLRNQREDAEDEPHH